MNYGEQIVERAEEILQIEYYKTLKQATAKELHFAIAKAVMSQIYPRWQESCQKRTQHKSACYFSAEFLMGRAVYNNLYCLGVLDEVNEALKEKGTDLTELEDIEDDALGNGGLGRLAACFLDSAATHDIPLTGYGIRYQYGLFRQAFENGFQVEYPDDWQRFGDPWSVRREDESVLVSFSDQTVRAVPYDMPIIGYATDYIGTLRLWQSEAICPFNLEQFNAQHYDQSVKEMNDAQTISRILYPNDDTDEGKKLRLKQQYFFCSASLQSIVRDYKKDHDDFSQFPDYYAIQLNDTHPVVSIAELMRILIDEEDLATEEAFSICQKTFAYTNHTILAEALEKWNVSLFASVLPRIYTIIQLIDEHLQDELKRKGLSKAVRKPYQIIENSSIHMARLAIYGSSYTNGVAKLHTEILKDTALHDWYVLYPNRFQNKTNGITQRRWLGLCNPELSALITSLIGDRWLKHLEQLKQLEVYQNDEEVLRRFISIKQQKKRQLSEYINKTEGVTLNPEFLFDIQVKRLHEYKRQLLNAFSILDLYFQIKDGTLRDFTPTAFIFGAKSAPGYRRAKAIIKLIHEIARLIDSDEKVRGLLQVVFVSNYRVSYAEKLIPAADVSEQISTAGLEASGTGNMKLMLNGAVTLGTLDGANVEIVEQAGRENNYIFGATVEEIASIRATYSPMTLYLQNDRIRRVMDSLIDGTLDDGKTGMFRELYDAILEGASWHQPDHYFLLHDFERYVDAKLQVNRDYQDSLSFAKKCWLNLSNAGMFSSDRTILQYADEIWHVSAVK